MKEKSIQRIKLFTWSGKKKKYKSQEYPFCLQLLRAARQQRRKGKEGLKLTTNLHKHKRTKIMNTDTSPQREHEKNEKSPVA